MGISNIVLLAVAIALQILILGLLLRRRLEKRFTWFFVYTLYVLLEEIIRLAASGNQGTYFKVYWCTEILDVTLTILALRESFLSIFWPEARLWWFRWIFWSGIGLALIYGFWESWILPPRQASRLVTVMIELEFVLDAVVCIFGLLYAGFVKLFSILEHQRASAIILGFTVNASIATFGWLTRSAFGTRFKSLSGSIPAVAYILAEAIWTRDLLRPEWKLPEPTQTLEEMRETMVRSIAILNKYLGREA